MVITPWDDEISDHPKLDPLKVIAKYTHNCQLRTVFTSSLHDSLIVDPPYVYPSQP